MSAASRAPATDWCTFTLAGGLYGVDVDRMHEVLRPQPLTRVPLAPPAVAGLLNLRGQIVPALDPRIPLGLDRAAAPGALVVVRAGAPGEAGSGLIALLVDEIGDVQRADAGAPRERVPVRETGPLVPSLASATVPLADQLLVVLDLDRLLERAFERPGLPSGARPAGTQDPSSTGAPAGPAPRSPGDRS